jgi:hypothetical protein
VPHSIQRCQASDTSRSAASAATSLCHRAIQSSARPSSSARDSAPGGGAALPRPAPAPSAAPAAACSGAASRGPAAMAGPSVAAASGVHPGAAPPDPVAGCGCGRAIFSGSAMWFL